MKGPVAVSPVVPKPKVFDNPVENELEELSRAGGLGLRTPQVDLTDGNQTFSVSIQMMNGVPEISYAPVSPRRRYELMGALRPAGPWATTNDFSALDIRATNRFFKARVSLP